jgi:hypothetical protein
VEACARVVKKPGSAADSGSVWFLWALAGLVGWLLLATLVAVVLGRGIRLADRRSPGTGVDDVLTTGAHVEAPVRTRRRALPLPPVGIALAVLAVALETAGFVTRLTGSSTTALSMDAPDSLPRLYVAALFGAAAASAFLGAGVLPGRRTWWVAVGLVSAGIAAVKAGSTVHADAMHRLATVLGSVGAQVVSALLAVAVVGALWFLSRTDRRDRRRVLGWLSAYAVAAVGLSALSSVVPDGLTAVATYLEESGEALSGVAFLVAVLVGVAPRLVLPAGVPLRRAQDAHTVEALGGVLGGPAAGDVTR